MQTNKRTLLLVLLGILAVFLFILGSDKYFTLDFFSQKRALIFGYATSHPFLFALSLFSTYVLSIFFTLPLSSILCLLSGMLYPPLYAIALGIFSETLGALILFLFIRFSLNASTLEKKLSSWKKTQKQIKENKIYYLLFFRASHLIPYWLINTIAAAFRIPVWTFVWTTLFGVFPFVFLMVETGEAIKHAFSQGHHLSLADLFTTKTQAFLVCVGLITLTPLLVKKFFAKKTT